MTKKKESNAWLKPKKDTKVRDPRTGEHLPAKGAMKPLNTYWRRRLRDGDVEQTEVATKKPGNKPAAKANQPKED